MAGQVQRHPDRIDFQVQPKGILVIKFYKDPNGGMDQPASVEVKPPDWHYEEALQWCTEHGYTLRRWPTGARVWKGEKPWPIRPANQVFKRRRSVEQMLRAGIIDGSRFNYLGLDFALDY